MDAVQVCPIETALKYIGKKWSLNVIRDMFMGKKRFKEFLESNPDISTKMLSARLRELEEYGIIDKNIHSKSPLVIEYSLTQKGKSLNKVLYELALFSVGRCDECKCQDLSLTDLKQTLSVNCSCNDRS